jgi:hypothetical protein
VLSLSGPHPPEGRQQAPIRLLEFAPPECLFQPPSRQMPTDRLVRPLPLSGMGKEQGAADSALLLPKSS